MSCAADWIDPTTMAHSRHTTKVFDSDLQELARVVAEMGGLAERQIAEAIEALAMRDSAPARRIIAADVISLKRSTLIFRYPQAGRPSTPSSGLFDHVVGAGGRGPPRCRPA